MLYEVKTVVDGQRRICFEVWGDDGATGPEYLESFQTEEIAKDYAFAMQEASNKRNHPPVSETQNFSAVLAVVKENWSLCIEDFTRRLLEKFNIAPK